MGGRRRNGSAPHSPPPSVAMCVCLPGSRCGLAAMDARGGRGALPCRLEEKEEEEMLLWPARHGHLRLRPRPHARADATDEDVYRQPRIVPDPFHTGVLHCHGMTPLISHVEELGFMEAMSIKQTDCFEVLMCSS